MTPTVSEQVAEPAGATVPDVVPAEPLLALRDVSKAFGGIRGLAGVDMQVSAPGVVHGLIGANGSGKSTLLGILSGQIAADAGTISLGGHAVTFNGPGEALAHGVAMVSQEVTLVPHLSVAENILLGRRQSHNARGIDWPDTRRRAAIVLGLLELDYDPAVRVSRLKPDQQQMVEIARAISFDSKILILDEPTSSLSDDEVVSLFAAVRRLTQQGVSTIFVSHRLPEMFELSDEITVLRDGVTVAQGATSTFDTASLVEAMVGRPLQVHKAARDARPAADCPRLSVRGLSSAGAFDGVDLDVAPGEIVGVAGLVGSGRGELLEALFGRRPVQSGSVSLDGEDHSASSPAAAIDAGVGFLPPDRKTDGVVLRRSIADNLLMVSTRRRHRLTRPKERDARRSRELMEAISIRGHSIDAPVSTLSGGNQQKVALGKWLGAHRSVLLLDEPTRGVDVGAKAEIYGLLRHAAEAGTSLLVSSSETDELITLCDRIVVMHAGRVVGEFHATTTTESEITRAAGGHHDTEPAR